MTFNNRAVSLLKTGRRRVLAGPGAALLATVVISGCGSSAPTAVPMATSDGTILPMGTSSGTIYWDIPEQSSPDAGFTEAFHGDVAGKALTGEVDVPSASPSNYYCDRQFRPGTVFTGSLGDFAFNVTESCDAGRLDPSYTGQVGGMAVHGTPSYSQGPADLGYEESIIHLTGSLGGDKVTITFPWAAPTPADPNPPGVNGQSVATVATITVTQG